MALKFFEIPNSISSDLPFFNEWKVSSDYYEDIYEITQLSRVKSGKGYLAHTSSFALFFWSNSKLTKQLIEALDYWTGVGEGYGIFVSVNKSFKDVYALASDSEETRHWFEYQGKYSITPPDISEEKSENPFGIIPSPLPPTMTGTSSKHGTRTRQSKKTQTRPREQRQRPLRPSSMDISSDDFPYPPDAI